MEFSSSFVKIILFKLDQESRNEMEAVTLHQQSVSSEEPVSLAHSFSKLASGCSNKPEFFFSNVRLNDTCFYNLKFIFSRQSLPDLFVPIFCP